MRRWLGPFLDQFAQIQPQSNLDASRFVEVGARPDRVVLGGNLKFDVPQPNPADPEVVALRRAKAGDWRVVLGGSTHPGEEEALLAAERTLEEQGLRIGLVLAPRHLERLQEVEATIRASGREACRWSELEAPLEAGILAAFDARQVILLDRYGLLSRLYGGAEVGFVGGSLVPVGGHNLLEPLVWGVPVVFGPHTANAREVRDEVLGRKLGTEVAAEADLSEALARYLRDPEAEASVRAGASRLFQENRGAVDRAVAALEALGALDRDG
jgi:3-deoxy-D-manno-octulosonic-acid transferase